MEKQKTLIITNSKDATTDLIIYYLGSDNVFRLNFDQWDNYTLIFDGSDFTITTQHHNISFNTVKKAYWRKPFIFDVIDKISDSTSLNQYINSEVRYCIKEIFSLCIDQRRAVLVSPFNYDRYGKLSQKRIASRYFYVAKSSIYWNSNQFDEFFNNPIVAKALSSPIIDNSKFLFTTKVSKNQLDIRYPWYLEDEINAFEDLTIVYLDGELFCYKLDRSTLKGSDWRLEIGVNDMKWEKTTLSTQDSSNVVEFMQALNLKFGRLDFLIGEDKLYFLEVNTNGQWAWLDAKNENGLMKRVCEILNPLTDVSHIV